MRTIKFRAWDKIDNEMGFVTSLDWMHEEHQRGIMIDTETDFNRALNCGDYVLMQYTGLKDRNGKEIYEGDIVKCNWNSNKQYNPADQILSALKKEVQIQEVFYSKHNAAFVISVNKQIADEKYKDEINLTKYRAEIFIEVIGNIYEHSNLIQ